jgi:hypothetical protein
MPDPSRPPPPACWCGDTHSDDCPEKAREESLAKVIALLWPTDGAPDAR